MIIISYWVYKSCHPKKNIIKMKVILAVCLVYYVTRIWLHWIIARPLCSQEVLSFEMHMLLFSCSVVSDSFVTHMDYNPPGSSVHGILQAGKLEWVLFSSPGELPDPGIEPVSPALAGGFFTTEPLGKPWNSHKITQTSIIYLMEKSIPHF